MTRKEDVPNVVNTPLSTQVAHVPAISNSPIEGEKLEDLLDAVMELLLTDGGPVSAKLLASKLKVNLPDAHLLLDELERRKMVSPHGDKGRELLVNKEGWASMKNAGVKSKHGSADAPAALAMQTDHATGHRSNVAVVGKTLPSKPHATKAAHVGRRQSPPGDVLIKDIIVGERFRKDYGDLQELAASIKQRGALIQSIAITPDKKLVCGMRRLLACRDILKWKHIPARIVDLDDIIHGEHDENELRKDFTASERVAIGKALEAKLPKERRGRHNPQNIGELKGHETAEVAAKAAGFGNAETYRQSTKAVEHGTPDLVNALDKEEISASTAAIISTLPRDEQDAVVTKGPEAMKKEAAKLQAAKKSKPAAKAKPVLETDPVDSAATAGADTEAPRKMLLDLLKRLTLKPVGPAAAMEAGSAIIFTMDSKLTQELPDVAIAQLIDMARELNWTAFVTADLLDKLNAHQLNERKKEKRRAKAAEKRSFEAVMKVEAEAGG